eukprot:270510-Amphidinium_carterae.1
MCSARLSYDGRRGPSLPYRGVACRADLSKSLGQVNLVQKNNIQTYRCDLACKRERISWLKSVLVNKD